MTLDSLPKNTPARIRHVGGERVFRCRLLELGLLPGVSVEFVRVAPLGDPLEFCIRGCNLSIRRSEAAQVIVDVEADRLVEGPR